MILPPHPTIEVCTIKLQCSKATFSHNVIVAALAENGNPLNHASHAQNAKRAIWISAYTAYWIYYKFKKSHKLKQPRKLYQKNGKTCKWSSVFIQTKTITNMMQYWKRNQLKNCINYGIRKCRGLGIPLLSFRNSNWYIFFLIDLLWLFLISSLSLYV